MFSGPVKAEWIEGEPRDMRLLDDLAFLDPHGKRWFAPIGSVINGASIPKALWTIVGSPYVGHYRRASVLHDRYCDARTEAHELVHQMFYDAMIEDGVDEMQARRMYLAVALFGPKWDENGVLVENTFAHQDVEDAYWWE